MKKTDLPLLGGISVTEFLSDYWHKKPLLIRQAIPGMRAILSRTALFKLASQELVESRLIVQHTDAQSAAPWQMHNGPFQAAGSKPDATLAALPPLTQKAWTLLVQSVNLHNDEADTLLRQFRFLPDARLDDLMISYATEGGGVGPHFDSYDVFLLQAHGQRRWRIGAQKDLSLLPNMPLKILAKFQPDQEFVLEPGDMLYLPPHYAHDGVALGECMTYSIGFRAPSYQELGEAFLQFMADSIDLPGRYADPDLTASNHPAEISTSMLETISDELNKVQFNEDDILTFLGSYLSEPKAMASFTPPGKVMSPAQFAKAASERGVHLSRKTSMLYHRSDVFINGEALTMRRADKPALTALANHRALTGQQVAGASEDVAQALYTWYQDGWLSLS
jgi:50S ribosomal protein L16 3-hydroxylase